MLIPKASFFVPAIYLNSILKQDFLFQVTPLQKKLDAQLNSEIALVPPNATLMTQYFIIPHMINRPYVEMLGNDSYYFRPEYILVDFNLNLSLNVFSGNEAQYIDSYLNASARNYTIYSYNGTAYLIKRVN